MELTLKRRMLNWCYFSLEKVGDLLAFIAEIPKTCKIESLYINQYDIISIKHWYRLTFLIRLPFLNNNVFWDIEDVMWW